MINNSVYTESEKMAALTISTVGGAVCGAIAGAIIDRATGNTRHGFAKIGAIGCAAIGTTITNMYLDEETRREEEALRQRDEEEKAAY